MKLSTLTTAVPDAASQKFLCKAWVRFDGTQATPSNGNYNGYTATSISFTGSSNISSVTKVYKGQYYIAFSPAMNDANYVVVGGAAKNNSQNDGNMLCQTNGYSGGNSNATGGCYVITREATDSAGAVTDSPVVTVAVFGN
jgi:hypothetical protein